jgi:hypothetical protein
MQLALTARTLTATLTAARDQTCQSHRFVSKIRKASCPSDTPVLINWANAAKNFVFPMLDNGYVYPWDVLKTYLCFV